MSIYAGIIRAPLALSIALIACYMVSDRAAAETLTDVEIATAVEDEYLRDDAVPFHRIDVVAKNGIVTLSGRVSNLMARQHAEELAGIVKGVRSVVNRIEVAQRSRSAGELAADVLAALKADPTTDSYEIDVSLTSGGIATLSGAVDTWAERSLVETVAMTVPGVTAIENNLEVEETKIYVAEGELMDHIRGRLRWDVRVDDSLITVLAREGGRVTLSGTVGSLAEKRNAEQLAWIAGVSSVDASHLEVARWARDEDLRRGKYDPKTDAEVRAALMSALAYDPRVLSAPIDIRVEDGTVWLSGRIDSVQARHYAAEDARNTVGVDRVINHLKVRAEVQSDAAISKQISNALRGKGLLETNEISVTVTDGNARLTGDVGTTIEYWEADRAVNAASGVESLHNDLTIRGRTPRLAAHHYGFYPRLTRPGTTVHGGFRSDRELYQDVESELFWSPFVDEDSVEIDVDDGVVTLSGTVGSSHEWRAANDNAFEAGAIAVHNDLSIAE